MVEKQNQNTLLFNIKQLRWFHIRTVHRFLATNTFLYNIGSTDSNLCSICRRYPDFGGINVNWFKFSMERTIICYFCLLFNPYSFLYTCMNILNKIFLKLICFRDLGKYIEFVKITVWS